MAELTGTIQTNAAEQSSINNDSNINTTIDEKEAALRAILQNNGAQIANMQQLQNLIGQLNGSGNLGANLENGLNNPNSQYIYLKFSLEYPTTDAEMMEANENTKYMGICITNAPTAPTTYTAYKWVKIVGDTGEQGIAGPRGADGTAFINIVNPLYITGTLKVNDWIIVSPQASRTPGQQYYYQKFNITDTNFKSTFITSDTFRQLTNSEVLQYLRVKLSQNISYMVDLVVSEDIRIGTEESISWNYLTRTFIEAEEEDIFLYFECYNSCPTVDLNYQLKVI